MILIALALVSYVSAFGFCSMANNREGLTNPDCNYAGVCDLTDGISYCSCCAPGTCGRTCDTENPTVDCLHFTGTTCKQVNNWYLANVGFRANDIDPNKKSDLVCNTIPETRAINKTFLSLNRSLSEEVNIVARKRGWTGSFKEVPECDTCSSQYPCTVGIASGQTPTSGFTFAFQVDFNEFYDIDCHVPDLIARDLSNIPECAANYDYGIMAEQLWSTVSDSTGFVNDFNELLRDDLGWENTYIIAMGEQRLQKDNWEWIISYPPTPFPTLPTFRPTLAPTAIPTQAPSSVPTQAPTQAPTATPTEIPTQAPSSVPTQAPTATPTSFPTQIPTATPTSFPTQIPTATPTQIPTVEQCRPYANNISDIQYIGSGTDCRAGLNMSYPGGLSCASPYIVCLPQENTPAQFGYESYYSSTHRYSIDECLQECANDQRCLGIEFVPDNDDQPQVGDCNLIDDIPVEITKSEKDAKALCYEKKDACYPYFEADDLDATMLNCYCPNNRKGFYTKKVKRTVENTRFCGNDSDIENSIKKAQANRMFHLCENWCLFDTENPTEEYWFWDPWKTCWREQEDASTYCTQGIEDPRTIEMQFLINRREHFCELN